MRFVFVLLIAAFLPLAASAAPAQTLDEFVERVDQALAKGAPYEGLAETLDPEGIMETAIAGAVDVLTRQFGKEEMSVIEMFRRQSRPDGAVITMAFTHENSIRIFVSMVLLRKKTGWMVVQLAAQTNYAKLPAYN